MVKSQMHAGHANHPLRSDQRAVTFKVLILNLAFLVITGLIGLLVHSLVLLASAIHLFADSAGLAIAYLAIILSSRPASQRHSFGLVRAEVLGALINGAVLLATSVWILIAALRDLTKTTEVQPLPIILLGIFGLVVSVTSVVSLNKHAGRSLNMKANILHMASDVAGWILTIASGVSIYLFSFYRADAIGSIAISVLVLASSWHLLSQTVAVLLEATPKKANLEEITQAISAYPEISEVHHLHMWNLASDLSALSTHIVMKDGITLHNSQTKVHEIKEMLKDRFGVDHVTIEIECHDCGDSEHGSHESSRESQLS